MIVLKSGCRKAACSSAVSFSTLLLTGGRRFLWFLSGTAGWRCCLAMPQHLSSNARPGIFTEAWLSPFLLNLGHFCSIWDSMAIRSANTPTTGDLKVCLVANANKWRRFQSTQDPFLCPVLFVTAGDSVILWKDIQLTKGQGCFL